MIEAVIFIAGMFTGAFCTMLGFLLSKYPSNPTKINIGKYIQQYKHKHISPPTPQNKDDEFEGYENLFPLLETLITDNLSGKRRQLVLTSYTKETYAYVRLHDAETPLSATITVEELSKAGFVFTPEPPAPIRTQEDMKNIVRKMIKTEKSVIDKEVEAWEGIPQPYLTFINNLKWKIVDAPTLRNNQ